ncbi:isoprenoid biosynthesis glyoxalase ElbB [Kangiella sp. HZ709]|uniref:isoprenoid biosynthesis glyoxalase ElbB n=1 Tax=Kangiella sp. HZ709 TaxID=2666328 RepID=UPI0012B0B2D1|nr:isoprenoid biosynthesis glyoxalase ElbB [Kangiella sp. HZ709]MRX27187.1 isoprenoid biosynthesis glyoxalase ElbB [Kangiella sp. HZ709]
MAKSVAVILSGCGFQDGAEIQESVMTLLALDLQGASYQCFAPDIEQFKVQNHLTGESAFESRNVLIESARIARGDIKALSEFEVANFDALVMPGGFGAALNLSTFAIDGAACKINSDVEAAVRKTYSAKKPIGALCIAPVILAKLIPDANLTIGNDTDVAKALESMGANHSNSNHGEVLVDPVNKLVTTPCYMLDAKVSDIYQGANALVRELITLSS